MSDWRTRAKCQDADPEMFFPHEKDLAGFRAAEAYCQGCPVSAECLALAMTIGAEFGVWGATGPRWRRDNGAERWRSPASQAGENKPHGTEARRQWERRNGIQHCQRCTVLGPAGSADYGRLTARSGKARP